MAAAAAAAAQSVSELARRRENWPHECSAEYWSSIGLAHLLCIATGDAINGRA